MMINSADFRQNVEHILGHKCADLFQPLDHANDSENSEYYQSFLL
jgi:hypothetical protein